MVGLGHDGAAIMTKALSVLLAVGLTCTAFASVAQEVTGPSAPQQLQQLESLQQRIEAQPEMMEAVRGLLDDPAFQEVLNDPEITAAVESGNLAVLLTNPKIAALVNHPTVQDMSKKIGQ